MHCLFPSHLRIKSPKRYRQKENTSNAKEKWRIFMSKKLSLFRCLLCSDNAHFGFKCKLEEMFIRSIFANQNISSWRQSKHCNQSENFTQVNVPAFFANIIQVNYPRIEHRLFNSVHIHGFSSSACLQML